MRIERADELIRIAREDIGMTQSELARIAKMQQPTISAYESGAKRPRQETLQRVLAAARARPSVPLSVYAAEIREVALRFRLSHVRVFGSTVRGQDTEESDIDLLVTLDAEASLFDIGAFAAAVEEITGFPVDVITDDHLQDPFFAHIDAEAVDL
ncbi:nucleotidyltransferase domain-containing protein [Curtobacterium sp. Leaf261]|uniref:nucleotidyltransferase domain-containing protein n=1 Tax=Curtobacterium sp. Leaf261 TaxID=1736311 RepID=UPI0006FEB16B|nr:XRE family transcriptional regulator [Curtobacterium sp. Leaf261]KQO62845.1 DNA-binding protein [Curtobacterium sp. Leaf261]